MASGPRTWEDSLEQPKCWKMTRMRWSEHTARMGKKKRVQRFGKKA
jgi:hypothetical protein